MPNKTKALVCGAIQLPHNVLPIHLVGKQVSNLLLAHKVGHLPNHELVLTQPLPTFCLSCATAPSNFFVNAKLKMSRFVPTLKALWVVAKQHGCYRDLRRLLLQMTRKMQFAHETQQLIQQRESCHGENARTPLPVCLLMRQIRSDVDYFQNVATDAHENDLRLRRIPLKPYTTRNRNMWAWIYLPPQNTFFE